MSVFSRVGRRSRIAATAFLLLFGALASEPLRAAEIGDIFTVADIHVDESGEAAADARTVALARGERRAFDELMRRLTVRADRSRLPRLGAEQVAGLVLDIAIANEKNSRVRYLADITYRFKPNAVRALMRANNIRYAETRSKPALVLPLYETAGTVALWEDPNPWRKAWQGAPIRPGLVTLKVPDGGLRDIAVVSAELAARGDSKSILAAGARYETDIVIVAQATMGIGREGRAELAISAMTHGAADREQTIVTTVLANANETTEALLERAKRETADLIEDNWKSANLIQFEQNSVLVAEMPLKSLREWVEAQKRFRNVAQIQRVDLVLMSREEARFNVFYLGDAAQLKLALAQQNLNLVEEEGAWTLTFNTRGGGTAKGGAP